jgi:hypothetical protein
MVMSEIRFLLAAGLSPMEVIKAGTQHAAYVSGQRDELGTLEPGKLADVIIVDGNPLTDIEALGRVVTVQSQPFAFLTPQCYTFCPRVITISTEFYYEIKAKNYLEEKGNILMSAPIALQLYTVRDALAHDFVSVVKKVANIGYAGVETAAFPGTTPREARKLFDDLGLTVSSAHSSLPVGERKNEVLDLMAELGCKRLVSAALVNAWFPPPWVPITTRLLIKSNAPVRW